MEELLKLLIQSSGAATVAGIAFYYGNKHYVLFLDTLSGIQTRFNNTIDNHLREANVAQKEDARAKIELALKLEALTASHNESKAINEKLYLELLRVKRPNLGKKKN